MQLSVYVRALNETSSGVLVKATNGGPTGPPAIDFVVTGWEGKEIKIGDCYQITIAKK